TRTEITTGESAVSVSVIDREEIDRKNINSIGDLFRTLPGTSTTNEGAFQVRPRVRGLESNRVLILVDGERLNNSRTSTGQSGIEPGLVESSQVQTIEVVRGGGTVLYGTDALAGTINIITRDTPPRREKGFRFGGVFNTFYTSNENGYRGNLEVNGSGNRFAFRVAQSMERFGNYFTGSASDGDLENLRNNAITITDEGEVLNSQSHGSNTQATARFFLNDTNTLKLNYERRRGANIGSAGLVDVFNAFFPFSNRDKFNLRYDMAAVTENLQRISVKAFYQIQDRNFTNILTVGPVPPFFPGLYQSSETITNTTTAGFDLQTDWLFGRHNIVAGSSFFEDNNTDRRTIVTSTTSFSPNRTTRNSRSVPDASLSNLAFFVQDDYRLTSKFRLIGGVRYDRFRTTAQETTDFALDPRFTPGQIETLGLNGLGSALDVTNSSVTGDIGAVYSVTPNVNVSARIGRSFRTPNISERFFTDPGSAEGFLVGNPNLVPETGINFDTGVRFKIKGLHASATYFNNYFENFLSTQPTSVTLPQPPRPPLQVFQTQNIAQARIQGFETELEMPIRISFGYLTPYGNFSYLRGDDLRLDQPLNTISPFRTNVGFRWQNFGKNYYFDYNVRIVAKQERLSDSFLVLNGGPEPGFVSHNIGGGYYFRRERFNFSINAGVSNLLGRFYSEQFVTAPARGRSFTIGTTWELK
ncbi:MAG TPA: TonB-dependent receptor, partial [Pyrinomonadaceae bacterium]|nr:TonB-dependent receptor [Pyrinomonadaceae bacterium]